MKAIKHIIVNSSKNEEVVREMGLNFNSWASSTVTAAKKRITVMLSINIDKTAEIIIKVIKIGIIL